MKGKIARLNPFFLRNQFSTTGKWGFPIIHRQPLISKRIELISYSDIKKNDVPFNTYRGVHFFIDDYRFLNVYVEPQKSYNMLKQYAFLCSPDNSMYLEMDLWKQIEAVAINRWCGAYWQSKGLIVYPTISWGRQQTFDFCFDGIEENSVVVVSTISCRKAVRCFMKGYDFMRERINPSIIICFGKVFPEMRGEIICIDYMKSKEVF